MVNVVYYWTKKCYKFSFSSSHLGIFEELFTQSDRDHLMGKHIVYNLKGLSQKISIGKTYILSGRAPIYAGLRSEYMPSFYCGFKWCSTTCRKVDSDLD
jgi:hypothetical protein